MSDVHSKKVYTLYVIYGRYEIYKDGKIYSLRAKKYLTLSADSNGYKCCNLWNGYYYTKHRVHRLVAEYFLEKEKHHREVNHKDGDRMNSDISNLEWCTSSENNAHAHKNIKRKSNRKLSFEEIEYIKTCGKTGKELSIEFGMSSQHMNALKRGEFQIEFTEKRESK